MMSEEPSDWDSMSDPATEDQPSSLDIVGRNDAMAEKIDSKPKTRPKSAHNRAQDSPSLIAQKQRISEGIRNQSFDLSENGHYKQCFTTSFREIVANESYLSLLFSIFSELK